MVGLILAAAALLTTLAVRRSAGHSLILLALLASGVSLVWLGIAVRRYGLFSIGGITWAMFAGLFFVRWFFPPVSSKFITAQAVFYYDRNGGMIAGGLMICCFTVAYVIGSRRAIVAPRLAEPSHASHSVSDLLVTSVLLIVARLATGLFLHIGIPGRQAVAVPFVGVIYYATSYGPLAGAALIIWFGRDSPVSSRTAFFLLLSDVLVESLLGSHGTVFLAILVYGCARATVGRPIRHRSVKAVASGVAVGMVIASALFISFVARESLNGGARQTVGDIPAFIATRFGGLEYAAPVVGAINHTGSGIHFLHSSSWRQYMTSTVYGLPADANTGFAATAVGWWYGLGKYPGVLVGAISSGLLAGIFDRWSFLRRRTPSSLSVALAIGVSLGWATFFLGGTIGSLGGISIGFTGIALLLAQAHRFIREAANPSGGRRKPYERTSSR